MRKVSDLLKEEREHNGFPLDYIEAKTKIRKEYLTAIEDGRFHALPSESYALGFVKIYAEFLGLPKNKMAALFRREYKEEEHEILPEFRKQPYRFTKSFLFNTQTIFFLVLFLVGAIYIFFQYNSFIFGPPLSVSSPKNGQVIQGNVVQITGKTDPYATVIVDKEETFVQLDGSFKKYLYVFPGNKKISIVTKNRFGKETKMSISVTVR